jgi:hypothetical protein
VIYAASRPEFLCLSNKGEFPYILGEIRIMGEPEAHLKVQLAGHRQNARFRRAGLKPVWAGPE